MRYGSIRPAGLAIIKADTADDVKLGGPDSDSAPQGAKLISRPAAISEEDSAQNGTICQLSVGEVSYDVTLPDPAESAGQHIYMVNNGNTGEFTLKSISGLINGADGPTGIAITADAYEQFRAMCNGFDWFVGRFPAALQVL